MKKLMLAMASCLAVLCSNAQVSLPWTEGFEGMNSATYTNNTNPLPGLSNAEYWRSRTRGRLRTNAGSNYVRTGNRSLTFDVSPSGTYVQNYYIQTLDLSSYTSAGRVELSFYWKDWGDEGHTGDGVWIRGSSTDAWISIYPMRNLVRSRGSGSWNYSGQIDITAALRNRGQNFSSTTQIRFGQYDNFATNSDGICFDDLEIIEIIPNDGSLEEMKVICSGNSSVEVELGNFGTNTLTSAVIEWSINGVPQPKARLTGLSIPYKGTATVSLGTYNVAASTSYSLLARVDSINQVKDPSNGNDTLRENFQSAFSGTYVIGSNGDYTSLKAAADTMSVYGICGPVVFEIKDSVFDEDVLFTGIRGMSATNTLRLTAAPGNQNAAVLDGTLEFNGCQHVRVDHLELTDTEYALRLSGYNHHFQIDSNYIHLPQTNRAPFSGIRDESNGRSEDIEIFENTIEGSYYGIHFRGGSSSRTNRDERINVHDNIVRGYHESGIYFDDMLDCAINGNTVQNDSTEFSPYGIELRDCNIMSVQNNHIVMYGTGGGYGIAAWNNNSSSRQTSDTIRIINNIISCNNPNANSTEYGIYLSRAYYTQVYYNSVYVSSNSTRCHAFYTVRLYNSDVQNNIFESAGNSGITWRHLSTYSSTTNSNNLYWNGTPGVSGASGFTMGPNSIIDIPRYRNPLAGDLKPNSLGADSTAAVLAGITTDHFGNPRNATHPDMGAYEFDVCNHDLGLLGMEHGYGYIPAGQSVRLYSNAKSFGLDSITGADIILSNNTGTTNSFIGTLQVDQDTLVSAVLGLGIQVGTVQCRAVGMINQTDCGPDNDTLYKDVYVSDTVYSHEVALQTTLGIGLNNSPGEFGQTFEVYTADTVSSVSFYLVTPAIGSSVRARIYTLDTNGFPDQAIDSSRILFIDSNGAAWHHMEIGCGTTVLQPGMYFLGLEQMNPVNASIGYVRGRTGLERYVMVDLGQGGGWLRSNDPGLNPIVDDLSFLLRMNFGRWGETDLLEANTTICDHNGSFITPSNVYRTMRWSTGSFKDSIHVSTAGTFYVDAWDELACLHTDTTIAVISNPIQITSTPTAATCGLADGDAVVQASGGTSGPFIYDWSNGVQGDTARNLAGNTYHVTVTDVNGCQEEDSVLVLGAFPDIGLQFNYPICNGDANGVATASINKGVAPYTYSWSAGGSASNANNVGLTAGKYYVTVTDASTCQTVDSIDVLEPAVMTSTTGVFAPSACNMADGAVELKVNGGMQPYQYFWSDPNAQTTAKAIGLSKGYYDVTITDSLGCVKTVKLRVVDPNSPVAQAQDKQLNCSYDTTTASVIINGGTGPFTYAWDYQNAQTHSITGVPAGNYKLHLVDALGCDFDTTVVITAPDPISAMFSSPAYYGPGSAEVTVTASGGTPPYQSYTWSNGETSDTARSLPNGVNTVEVIDDNGCSFEFTIDLFDPTTGWTELSEETGPSVFPNPTSGLIKISFPKAPAETTVVRLISSLGSTLETYEYNSINHEIVVDISTYSNGVYFLDVQVGNEQITKRIHLVH